MAATRIGTTPSGQADEVPHQITTDTLRYCEQLGHQVAAKSGHTTEVDRLLAEGREMCARGMVRGGILRMRRALVILHRKVVREDFQ